MGFPLVPIAIEVNPPTLPLLSMVVLVDRSSSVVPAQVGLLQAAILRSLLSRWLMMGLPLVPMAIEEYGPTSPVLSMVVLVDVVQVGLLHAASLR